MNQLVRHRWESEENLTLPLAVIKDHVARMEKGRSAFKMLTVKITGNKPLQRLRHGLERNIIMDLKEIGINTKNWVDSA